jgi:hypothetical protein
VHQEQQKGLSEICRCGKVKLEAVGRPILTASCHCASCQEAGSRFEQLASAPLILNPDGETDYVLYRKDRVRRVTGQEYLEEHLIAAWIAMGSRRPEITLGKSASRTDHLP